MLRKLIALALVVAGVARFLRGRAEEPAPAAAPYTPPPAPPQAEEQQPEQETEPEDVRADQPSEAGIGDAVMPDTSADDPLVREAENAARAEAGAVGGPADTETAGVDPEMRPVVEGSGDSEETFEATEDEGR